MMISREVIEEIRSRSDIVELIGSYVNLKRAGSNYNVIVIPALFARNSIAAG